MPIDTEVQEDDLRSSIEAEFNKSEVPVETVEAPEVEVEAAPEALEDHPTDPARYANGKFKPTKEAAPEKVETQTDIPSTDTAKAIEPPAPTPSIDPPAGWTAAEKAEWSKLPPAIQTAVSRREQEISRGGQQWSEEKRRYEAVLAPATQAFRSRNIGVEEGLNRLLSAQDFLDRDPANAIQWLAKSYGVDLANLAGQPAEGSVQSQPDISALVRQAVQPLLAPIQQRFASEDERQQQSVISFVEQFASQPGHEHFHAVEADIMDLIPGIRGRNPSWDYSRVLQEAYDRAVFANPDTRASLLSAREAEAEAKRVADAKVRADKARRAGSSVNGSPNGAAAPAAHDSLRAEIEAAFTGS